MEDLFLLKEDIHKTWTGMRLRLTCLERFSMLHALHVEITLEFLAWAAAVQVLVSCEFFFSNLVVGGGTSLISPLISLDRIFIEQILVHEATPFGVPLGVQGLWTMEMLHLSSYHTGH